MKIGIICPSEIAIRRFMPALQKNNEFSFLGVGVFDREERYTDQKFKEEDFQQSLQVEKEKANVFISQYGGRVFDSYTDIITSSDIDAIYIPLPPALHYKWAKKAIESGKHVFVEKPATINAKETKELVKMAEEKGLAFHENYMFAYHEQLDAIDEIVRSGELGEIRLYRISFGFPMRPLNDFRYNKSLGGGALIDAGGYTIRYATRLLGETTKICQAQSNFVNGFDVDMYGSAVLTNEDGVTAQVAFGMDNTYKCELEIWGSKGSLKTGRVLTAPAGFIPSATIYHGNEKKVIELPADDAFLKSIQVFSACIKDKDMRKERYQAIVKQAELIDDFKVLAGWIH